MHAKFQVALNNILSLQAKAFQDMQMFIAGTRARVAMQEAGFQPEVVWYIG
jgi:hypothetical protein